LIRVNGIPKGRDGMKSVSKALLINIFGLKGGYSSLEIIQQRAKYLKLIKRRNI